MKLNMGSKKNMGAFTMLALVLVLTQSRAFDFLTESPLGRLLLLACIIFIAYTSKFIGLLAVLVVIFAYNQYGMNVVSGFSVLEGAVFRNPNPDLRARDRERSERRQQDFERNQQRLNNFNPIPTITRQQTTEGREGFVMTDREAMILRGKQSNTIPVFGNAREQNDDVSPSDTSVFVSDFSSV